VTIGSLSLPSYSIVNIAEALFMLAFFIYMTGRLRTKQPPPSVLVAEEVDGKFAEPVAPPSLLPKT